MPTNDLRKLRSVDWALKNTLTKEPLRKRLESVIIQ